MARDEVADGSSTDGLPVAPSLGPTLEREHYHAQPTLLDRRSLFLCGVSMLLALAAAIVAQVLTALIALITNLSFYQRLSLTPVSPAGNHLGWLVMAPPVIGALIIGVMARYGSSAIRGHGIPEAMERVLQHESKIPPHMTWLKPISAAISIGTGGPFGAEGPIIATGGSLGSLWGQLMHTTSHERKTLLAAGAAAGMAATFGTPVSAVLLAIELLLFEWSPRSLVPVGLACVTASTARVAMVGPEPVFPMPVLDAPSPTALVGYVLVGAIVGAAAVLVTRAVYAVEDAFEKLPIHWMWWPAIGALVVGFVGVFAPRTMGVGYDNIEAIVSGHLVGRALVVLCALKFISWVIALGSGTSGGTLAPLFTVGGGLGASIGALLVAAVPAAHLDPRLAALVGMAAMFAGASRAVLASVVFAFETTRQPTALLPLLGGCAAAFLVASAWMRQSIMTVKIARRGVYVPDEYGPDPLAGAGVAECATRAVTSLRSAMTIAAARDAIASVKARHAAFPVCDDDERVVGLVSHRVLLAAEDASAPVSSVMDATPLTMRTDRSLREAVGEMVQAGAGRVVLVDPGGKLAGIVTQRDVISAWRRRALS